MNRARRMVLFLWLVGATLEGPAANPFLRDIAAPGNEAYRAEEYSKAAAEYLKARDLEPLSAELRLNLGAAYYREEEYDKAVEEFGEAIRADDPRVAASAHFNRGNAKYKGARREFEAASVSGATQTHANPAEAYVKKLEDCILDYQECLKREPSDADAKYNIEMIRREIKNLMRRQPQNQQQQQQQQSQEQQDQQNREQQQQQQDQQNQQQNQEQQSQTAPQQGEDSEEKKSEDQQQNQREAGQATPTPQQGQESGPTPTAGQEDKGGEQEQAPTPAPTQMLSISEEMARNLLDNLPETRPRTRPRQRARVEKDW
ncbi:MAG: hypothetical protein GHCLOJNM_01369 [bacterium]|nr:hypothetical protein [bacterium]